MVFRAWIYPLLLLLVGTLIYAAGAKGLRDQPRAPLDETLRVVMPAYIQVLLAWGDRYLAADLGMFRAVTLSAIVRDRLTYEVQAKIQQQASILNPRHEDNGYLAAAILPWEGQVDRAQYVLDRATRYRFWDPEPPFYQGFNELHFNRNFQQAGKLATIASDRSVGVNKRYFRIAASKWYAKSEDRSLATNLLKALKESTTDKDIKQQLDARIRQVEGLRVIQTAVDLYTLVNGHAPESLTGLLEHGYLVVLPEDPFNYGYGLDNSGNAMVLNRQDD